MTKVPAKLLRHKNYPRGLISLTALFELVNPEFDWKAEDRIIMDYDAKDDTLTVRRPK